MQLVLWQDPCGRITGLCRGMHDRRNNIWWIWPGQAMGASWWKDHLGRSEQGIASLRQVATIINFCNLPRSSLAKVKEAVAGVYFAAKAIFNIKGEWRIQIVDSGWRKRAFNYCRPLIFFGSPNGTRTRVFGVRGRYPRPLDDGTAKLGYKLLVSKARD